MSTGINIFVQSLCNERGLEEDIVYSAIEAAIAVIAGKQYETDAEDGVWIEVVIDRQTGLYDTYRSWMVVADDAVEDPMKEISLTEACQVSEDMEIGCIVREQIESPSLGRIAAQQAKQIILQKVREAERQKIADLYQSDLGKILHCTVKRRLQSGYIVELSGAERAEAFLPREHLISRETFRQNDRVRVVLFEIADQRRGPQLMVSRTRPELLIELFKVEVPEIAEEVITIQAASRDPGSRAKIAVKTNDGRVDPIGACVGMRGSRVQAVSNELNGERIDIILWDDNPAKLAMNALSPAEVASIVVDEETQTMDVGVQQSELSQAIGRGGQNVRLASELCQWTINVMSEEALKEKSEAETTQVRAEFESSLGLSADLAGALLREGYTTIEELAYAEEESLMKVPGIDQAKAEEIQMQASDYLLSQEMANDAMFDQDDVEEALLQLEGMNAEYAAQLVKANIKTRDDLADCSVGELCDVIEISEADAAALIMVARAHWFEETSEAEQ